MGFEMNPLMSSSESSALKSILSTLTTRIEADLPGWYGANARLAGALEFHPRAWSYFFRCPIRVNGNEDRAILVKIRHTRDMKLSHAVASVKMGEEAREEYKSLEHLLEVFGREEHSSLFFAVRPLAFYESLNAVVMEEAGLRSLRSLLGSPQMLVSRQAHNTFESYLGLAGRWLRIFHDAAGRPAGEGYVFSESSYENARQNLAGLEDLLEEKDRSTLTALLEKLYRVYGRKTVPQRILHDDFTCANIFVTKDHRICCFDPKNSAGPIYVDLARISIDLETCRAQILTNGLAMSFSRVLQFHTSLLRGYFASEPADHSLLNLFRLLDLLGHWRETESRLENAPARNRFLYAPAVPLMRNCLLRLLREQARERLYGL